MSAEATRAIHGVLASTPTVLKGLLENLDDDSLATPRDEGWSVKDVVAHLTDTEWIAFAERIRRMAQEDHPFIASIDPSARLLKGGYGDRSLEDLLDELARRRSANLDLLARLTPTELRRIGEHDQAGQISIEEIIHQWAYHDLMHLKQIASMLQAPLVEGMGNTRRFYDL